MNLPVQKRRGLESNEELATVRVRPRIRHGTYPGARVLKISRQFVLELSAVDGLAAASCSRRVPALYHKVANCAVEDRPVVVAEARQLCDVVAGARGVAVVQFDYEGSSASFEFHVGKRHGGRADF